MPGRPGETRIAPMNLWFRLLCLILASFWRPRLAPVREASRLRYRVWPHDLDPSLHLNNGRYWSIADLGRTDLILRSGLWRAVLRHRWIPVVSAATIRFRRELRPLQTFTLDTRIVTWGETWIVIEQQFIAAGPRGKEALAAIALVRVGLYDRGARAFIATSRLFAETGTEPVPPPAPTPDVVAFLAAEEGLRRRV